MNRHEERFLRQLYEGQPARRRHVFDALWTWRHAVLVVPLLAGFATVAWRFGGWGVLAAASVVTVPLATSVDHGSRLIRVGWCVVDQHRLRKACAETGVHTRSGRRPLVLRAQRTQRGERLTVWCPAGLSADDPRKMPVVLAAACFPGAVSVAAVPGRADLAIIEIIRWETGQ